MDRVTAFAILWGRARVISTQPQKGSGSQKASLNRSPPPQTIGQPAAAIEPLGLSEIQKPEDVVYCELRLGLA